MVEAIKKYVDRIFAIVRPRKLLYLAIDGVAPRAKMNQQRSRRFRAAKEAREKAEKEEELNQKLAKEGRKELISNGSDEPFVFDSNVITPGTQFMEQVAKCLQQYVVERMRDNAAWQNVCFMSIPHILYKYSF